MKTSSWPLPVYVFVTTNAAVGTDQDGGAFWEKICDSFVKREGLPTRSLLSFKNRFKKVFQAEINKSFTLR